MGSTSDFQSLEDWNPVDGADLMAFAEQSRLVIGTGASVMENDYFDILRGVEWFVMQNWHHFEEGGVSLGPLSFGKQTPRTIAKAALLPLRHTADLLQAAQLSVVKTKQTYLRYVAQPIRESQARRNRPARGFNGLGGL